MASAGKIEPINQKNSAFLTKVPFLLIFFAVLYLLVDYLSYYGPVFVPIILGAVAVLLLFIDQKKFVYFITVLLLLSDDQSKFIVILKRFRNQEKQSLSNVFKEYYFI